VLALGVSFGAAARPVIGMLPADVMSVVVFGASAQTATVGILGAGGAVAAAVAAGLLINLRFLPMCLSVGPSLPGGWRRRALAAQAVVDASWALARRDDGTFDWPILLGSTLPQAAGWWAGTAVGTAVGAALPAPDSLGLDAVFPAFFLALLAEDLRRLRNRRDLPARVNSVIALLPAALLAGLVATDTFTRGNHGLVLDARSVGLAAAAVAVAMRAPMLVVIVTAAVATALVRALA
jgi:predicted branched-subunit amino acid permease